MEFNEKTKIQNLADSLREAVLEKKEKVLFVIGAGCSAEAGIKTSKQIIEEFDFGFSEDQIRTILRQNNLEVPFEDIPMEAYLSAYKDIFGTAWDDIKSKLRDFFPDRYEVEIKKPPLGYALLAHLMKYNFVHSIISLNFDELLEQALDDSLGVDGYKIVASRSAFGRIKDSELFDESRVIYKPHGTISMPMTLRATWERVNRLDNEKIQVLNSVLKKHSIWVFVGYRFTDLDIAPIFLYSAKNRKNLKIWFINRDKHNKLLTKNQEVKDKRIKKLLLTNNCQDEEVAKYFIRSGSDHFFRKFIKYLFDKSKNEKISYYRKGSGYRILDILYENGLDTKVSNRIIYRIFLFSLITKGKFTDRALMQFTEIKNLLHLSKDKTITKRNSCENNKNTVLSSRLKEFRETFQELFFSVEQGVNTVYYLKDQNDLFSSLTKFLVKKLPNKDNIDSKIEKKIIELLKDLWNDSDILINEHSNDIPFALSSSCSKFICNLQEFYTRTHSLIFNLKNNDSLNIIAETGEWLLEYRSQLKNKKIKLIITNPGCDIGESFHKKKSKEIIEDLQTINGLKIKYLPFIENRYHMSLSVNHCEGIFFTRDAKSPFITPIYVAKEDFDKVNKYFNMLWSKKATKEECTTRRCT